MKILFIYFFTLSLYSHEILEYNTYTKDILKSDKYGHLIINTINKYITSIDKDLNIKLTNTTNKDIFINNYINSKTKVITLSSFEYFSNQKKYDKVTKKRWFHKMNNQFFEQFYLLGKKSDQNIFNNLDTYTIHFQDGILMSSIWFKNMIYKKYKSKYSKIIKNEVFSTKPSHIINKLFFGKNNLAVISKRLYDTLTEINPQIRNKLKVVLKSEKIYLTILTLVNKNITKEEFKTLEKFTNNTKILLEESTMVFGGQVEGTYELEDKQLLKLKKEIQDYLKLKKIYN